MKRYLLRLWDVIVLVTAAGWLAIAVYLMSTAHPSGPGDAPTWLRYLTNGIVALGLWGTLLLDKVEK